MAACKASSYFGQQCHLLAHGEAVGLEFLHFSTTPGAEGAGPEEESLGELTS